MARFLHLLRPAFRGGSSSKRCVTTAATPSTTVVESAPSTNARMRFAPSPTGYLHLGGLRTALFNHLLARRWKGKWVLRIEDTDRTRLVEDAVDNLRRTLEWAGLDYDEGVGVGGSKGPYIQSERLDLYHQHAKELMSSGHAYECFCTHDDLRAIKLDLATQGHRHSYDGRCRHLTREEVDRRKRAGHKYVIRFNVDSVPDFKTLPPDIIFGDPQLPMPPDDFVIIKSDNWPTYHFASVVDDHHMGITHVLRGEEWLPSVPKHHQIYSAFGWTPPSFAHLPLLVNMDGTKLSKRTGDVRVEHYRDKGYEPEAIINFLALMGWDHHSALNSAAMTTDDPSVALATTRRSDSHSLSEIFTMSQLVASFSLDHVNHRQSAVNMSKLDFLNKMTLRRKAGRLGKDGVLVNAGKDVEGVVEDDSGKSKEELVVKLQGELRKVQVLKGDDLVEDLAYVEKVFDVELPRTTLLVDIASSSIFFFLEPSYETLEAKSMMKDIVPMAYINNLSAVIEQLRHRLDSLAAASNDPHAINTDIVWDAVRDVTETKKLRARSEVLTPMRHALTGRKKGPSVPDTMVTLGVERSMARLEAGLAHVRKEVRERGRG